MFATASNASLCTALKKTAANPTRWRMGEGQGGRAELATGGIVGSLATIAKVVEGIIPMPGKMEGTNCDGMAQGEGIWFVVGCPIVHHGGKLAKA